MLYGRPYHFRKRLVSLSCILGVKDRRTEGERKKERMKERQKETVAFEGRQTLETLKNKNKIVYMPTGEEE